ncbi:hypothetical protein C3L29_039945, partial [Pseudomonas sp. MWU12-2534b]
MTVAYPGGTTLAANVERMTYIGSQDFIAYGNDSDNVITGRSGTDTLPGGARPDPFFRPPGPDLPAYTGTKPIVLIHLNTTPNIL